MVIKVAGIFYPIKAKEVLAFFREENDIVIRFKDLSRIMKLPCISQPQAENALIEIEKKFEEYYKS